MATQKDIAFHVGLDVSSVCKILNKYPGPVFKRATIKLVFDAAKLLGYNFKSNRVGRCRTALRELVQGGHLTGVSAKRMEEYKKLAGVA